MIADQVEREGHIDFSSEVFQSWARYLEVVRSSDGPEDTNRNFLDSSLGQSFVKLIHDGSIPAYVSVVSDKCSTRCFAISKSGRMCLVPPLTRLGDTIFVPFGAQVPYLIREVTVSGGQNAYNLIGEAYVHGIMNAELLEAPYSETRVLLQ